MNGFTSLNTRPNPSWQRRLWPLLLVVSWLPLLARAGDTLLLVDVSAAMADACPGGGSRVSGLLRNLIAEEQRGAGGRAGLIAYGADVRVLAEPGARGRDLADLLPAPGGRAAGDALAGALDQARRLLRGGGRLLVIGAGAPEGDGGALGQRLAALRADGVDLAYLAVGTGARDAMPLLQTLFPSVRHRACATASGGGGDPYLMEQLREVAARVSGMPPSLFDPDTDFVADLGLEHLTAYEIMSAACADLAVVAPERDDLTSLRRLADYLATAPPQGQAHMIVRGGKDEGAADRAPDQVQVQKVWFATNRERRRDASLGEMFSGERASRGRMTYGSCDVSIPAGAHKRGSLETPFLSLRFLEDPEKHVLLRSVDVLDERGFFRQVQEMIAGGRGKREQARDILVFIHGYNVSFEKAAMRTAQVAYDLEFEGLPMFFSWPSNGEFYAYVSDREDVEWSVPHIAGFLKDLADKAGGARIHVIAHSMGHEGLLRALNRLALERRGERKPMLENVIMAAPDFDAEIFADQVAPDVQSLARNWTLYASDKDVALNVSAGLRFANRLGTPLTLVKDVVTVDASGVEVTPWSVPEFHSYFATKQLVIRDIVAVLKGQAPDRRSLTRMTKDRLPYWRLSGVGAAQ